MTARERQQLAYELAFCPWRLNRFWRMYKSQAPEEIPQDELRALDDAALLHLPISESSYADVHALERLAGYQVLSSRYHMRTFLANVRERLGRPSVTEKEVPWQLLGEYPLPAAPRS